MRDQVQYLVGRGLNADQAGVEVDSLRVFDPMPTFSDEDGVAAAGEESPDLSATPESPSCAPLVDGAGLEKLALPITDEPRASQPDEEAALSWLEASASEGEKEVISAMAGRAGRPTTGFALKGMLPDGVEGYVVSVSRKQGFRRLHLLGACQRVPGLSYRDFEEYGLERPPPESYDDYCRACWPRGGPGADDGTTSGSSSEASLPTIPDSDGAGPAKAEPLPGAD